MELTGKKIAVLAENLFEDLELWYPTLRFREAGAEVTIIGPEATTYKSKNGYAATAELAAKDARAADFDAIIIPGGYAPDLMRRCEDMVNLVRAANYNGQIVAAICHGGWMLASADAVRGKRVTGFFAIRDDLKNAGGEYVDSEFVQDGNIITSRVPDDLPAFCRGIIQALNP